MPYISGLCSVSFRNLAIDEVVRLAADDGLIGIEWGSDVHVPVGDLEKAAQARKVTLDAGLDPASYGTYLRTGDGNSAQHLRDIVETTSALGASNIRIWAGPRGLSSSHAAPEQFDAAVYEIRAICQMAAEREITVSLEFHADTLADDGPSTARLLAAVDHPALFTYWQPTPGIDLATSLAEIDQLGAHISHVHVFNRDVNKSRGSIEAVYDYWQEIFAHVRPSAAWSAPAYAMIEFVQGDSAKNLARDSETLMNLLQAQANVGEA